MVDRDAFVRHYRGAHPPDDKVVAVQTTPAPIRRRRGVLVGVVALAAVAAIGVGIAATTGLTPRASVPTHTPTAPQAGSTEAPRPTVTIPATLAGEITRSTIKDGTVRDNAVATPALKNGVLIRVACSGPAHSTVAWSLVNDSGANFGPSGTIECNGRVETEGDAIAYKAAKMLDVQLIPSQGVTVAYGIVSRN